MKAAAIALALGLAVMGVSERVLAQVEPPSAPQGAASPAAPAQTPTNLQPPPPPPTGAQPPPGFAPYPYPPPQQGQPGYPSPYGYPGYPAPKTLPYVENVPVPPGYQVDLQMRKGLIISGAITFGISYGYTAIAGTQLIGSRRAPYGFLFLPVFGPFVVAAAGDFSGRLFGDIDVLGYVVSGVVQTGGAVMLLAGIFAKKKVLVRQDAVQEAYVPEFSVGIGSVGMKMAF